MPHGAGNVTLLESKVTAPFRANALPDNDAPVFSVMELNAMIFPTKLVVVPSVAELPTCQYTLPEWPPLVGVTLLLDAVVSVLPILKIKTALGLPWALRVRFPVN